jgi:hypothetical protein
MKDEHGALGRACESAELSGIGVCGFELQLLGPRILKDRRSEVMICMGGVFIFERWVGMEIGFGEGKREESF